MQAIKYIIISGVIMQCGEFLIQWELVESLEWRYSTNISW